MRGITIAIATGLVALSAATAGADTVVAGHLGGSGGSNAGDFWIADNSFPQYMADQFHLGAATSLSTVRWWGGSTDGLQTTGLTDFVITIFNVDSGGLPGTTTFSETIAVGSVTTSADAAPDKSGGWKYEADLSGHNLGAGDYFFSLYGKAASVDGAAKWVWQGLLDGGDGAFYNGAASGNVWADALNPGHPVDNLAWQLEGAIQNVPLPMPALLGGIGLLGLIPMRRRMMRSA